MEPEGEQQQLLVSTFLDIAVGQSADTAVRFLLATSWNLEEAIQLFFASGPSHHSNDSPIWGGRPQSKDLDSEYVRPPLPVTTETLYGDNYQDCFQESQPSAVWETDQISYNDASCDDLASLYRPPYALMHNGPFDMAKIDASLQDKWLLVNVQSTEEFASHMLNRDTWSNEAVAQTILTSFIFWQVFHDTTEGMKVCSYYKLNTIPAIMVIDPITGQKMHAWSGMVQPEHLLDDLVRFIDRGPKQHHVIIPRKCRFEKPALEIPDETSAEEDEEVRRLAVATSMEGAKEAVKSHATKSEPEPVKHVESSCSGKPSYPPLPEEPKTDRQLLCRVGIRLPDGRRVQRNFLRSDPVKFLWSFCCSLMEEGDKRPFHFTQAIPGISMNMDYESNLTFEEAALVNSMISLVLD